MFDADELRAAVEIQRRSYRLLLWVGDAIRRGFIRLERAHRYSSEALAAEAWLSEHFANLPADARPCAREGPGLRRFAAFFASYLLTSFDLTAQPGSRLVSDCGCYCWLCTRLVAGPHLRPKRLRSRDKQGAERLKRDYLEALARESGVRVDADSVSALLGDPDRSRQAALAAYGQELLLRCEGHASGPEVLALWRQFAWKPTGSPIPGFDLTAEDILEAERALAAALSAPPDAGPAAARARARR